MDFIPIEKYKNPHEKDQKKTPPEGSVNSI